VVTDGLRQRKKARTREAIQSAALRLFREQGYAATTMNEVRNAADVSESTLFRYFPTKKDLVLDDAFDPIMFALFKTQPAELSVLQAFRAAFNELVDGMSTEQRAEMQERIGLLFAIDEVRAAFLDRLVSSTRELSEAIAERTGRSPDDLAVRSAAAAGLGVGMLVMTMVAEDPKADFVALMNDAISELESGLTL
jgi:AcrR family transcriptional regulator